MRIPPMQVYTYIPRALHMAWDEGKTSSACGMIIVQAYYYACSSDIDRQVVKYMSVLYFISETTCKNYMH